MVQDVCDWGPSSYRGAVRVCWENRHHTVERYRVGGDGEVDLMALQAAEGYIYYSDHLPNVGMRICILYSLSAILRQGPCQFFFKFICFCFRRVP